MIMVGVVSCTRIISCGIFLPGSPPFQKPVFYPMAAAGAVVSFCVMSMESIAIVCGCHWGTPCVQGITRLSQLH